jgi:hypothetical protein
MKMIHFPKTRLSEMVARVGGISRSDAVEGAMTQMESMRGESDGVVNDAITAVEVIALAAGKKGKFDKAQMHDILRHGDQIVTLAGTFGYVSLDIASRSLCDVTDGLLSADLYDLAPILVHLQAMRMMAPGATPLKADEIEQVLAELKKVSAHFNVVPLADSAARLEFEPAADAT